MNKDFFSKKLNVSKKSFYFLFITSSSLTDVQEDLGFNAATVKAFCAVEIVRFLFDLFCNFCEGKWQHKCLFLTFIIMFFTLQMLYQLKEYAIVKNICLCICFQRKIKLQKFKNSDVS